MSKPFSFPHDLIVDYITEQLYFYSMNSTISGLGLLVLLWMTCKAYDYFAYHFNVMG